MSPSRTNNITVLDGGFATQLCCHVTEPIDGNPLWSASFLATDPQSVINTHLDFLRAGADAVMTNTYQASVDGFMTHLGLSREKSYNLIKKAVELANEAINIYMEESNPVEKRPLVVGSVGPYGASLHDYSEYTGDYVEQVTKHHIADWHRSRIQALVEAGVDILAFETIPAQKEGEALMELLKEFSHQKAWLSFSCKDEHHTSHGEKLDEAAKVCWDLNPNQLVAVGVNCLNPKFVTSLLSGINRVGSMTPFPWWCIPTAERTMILRGFGDGQFGNYCTIFQPVCPEGSANVPLGVWRWVDGDKCEPVETYIPEWLDLGAIYVGGCCRTYAHDVKRIKEVVQKWSSSKKSNCKSNGHV